MRLRFNMDDDNNVVQIMEQEQPVMISEGPNFIDTEEDEPKKKEICRIPGIFLPDKMQVKLRFTHGYETINQVAAGIFLRGNDIYDPTGFAAGQPNGYDQWAQLYQRYCVTASKLKFTFISTSSGSTPVIIAIVPIVDTSGATTTDKVMQQKYAQWNVWRAGDKRLSRSKQYMETGKLFGKSKKAIQSEVGYSGDIAGSPAFLWYWAIQMGTVDASLYTGYPYVEIIYYVTFYSRKV